VSNGRGEEEERRGREVEGRTTLVVMSAVPLFGKSVYSPVTLEKSWRVSMPKASLEEPESEKGTGPMSLASLLQLVNFERP
jgi:hypothetical protein